MAGPPVSLGCTVVLSPGAAGPPDSGVIVQIPQAAITANGLPLAVSGSLCQMVNSVTGAPYNVPVGPLGMSSGVTVDGRGLLRVGDRVPSGPGVLTVVGPPAAPFLQDRGAP